MGVSHHSGYPLGEQKGADDYRCLIIQVKEHHCVNGSSCEIHAQSWSQRSPEERVHLLP